ncbi:hypothetical protein MPH_13429 [Macrophomina phaseolina MS6]|uniref:DUF7703 domain-containing protein n=1 Tax=Macrophomina phaseolina (strain MS6) TaxID=1126212 RepID=K2R5T5_MACPH|nr:hypothetical protein MPH_13429 [Macrophomina phaseolina MS6]
MATDNGVGNKVELSEGLAAVLIAFYAIAWYNCLELTIFIWRTFKNRRGLYFWSCVVATAGIVVYVLGFILKNFHIVANNLVNFTLVLSGWVGFVTGQSLALYSRLHLVVRETRILRLCFYVIMCGVIFGHVPTCVIAFGANSSASAHFVQPYNIIEKIQLTIFFLQETFISVLYIQHTVRMLRAFETLHQHDASSPSIRTRSVLRSLIYVNLITTALDITLLAVEYSGQYLVQTGFKPAVYSVKLKLEFAVLNQLVSIIRYSTSSRSDPPAPSSSAPTAPAQLDTLERKRREDDAEWVELRERGFGGGPGVGHAYTTVVEGKSGRPERVVAEGDIEVTQTTEVVVEVRNERDSARSPAKEPLAERAKEGSRSSSQVEFAERGA